MQPLFLWQPWPGPWAPACEKKETELLRALKRATTGHVLPAKVSRDDITVLMDALRCGLSLKELRELTSGVSPARLVVAYNTVEKERRRSAKSWAAIISNATLKTITKEADRANRLLPVPVSYVHTAIEASEQDLARLVARTNEIISRVTQRAKTTELEMTKAEKEHAVELGLQLYHPGQNALWDHPFFLASRVGQLSSARVADLLGERSQSSAVPSDLLEEPVVPRHALAL